MKIEIKPEDTALEASLLKAMSKRHNFESYNNNIDYKKLLPTTALLLNDYSQYYGMYTTHEFIDFGLFYTQFCQNWHIDLIDQEISYYRDCVFPLIQNTEDKDVETCLLGLMKKQTSEKLKYLIDAGFDLSKIRDVLDNFELKQSTILSVVDKDITTMESVDFTVLDKKEGIPWCLPTLQEALGSHVKGQFTIISADYNTGKSALVVSQVVTALEYLSSKGDTRPIIYFNSEGTDADVLARICSNLYRNEIPAGFEEIVERREEVREKYLGQWGNTRLLVAQMHSSDVMWVRAKLKKYNPALVIIDITDTLAPEEDVQNLKKVYDQLRLMSGLYCPIIGTTQSGDTSYKDPETGEKKTRRWLNGKDLYGSKTGKGGAADTMIMIGKEDNNPDIRYISVTKTKRGKEVQFTCLLDRKYSLYKELAW